MYFRCFVFAEESCFGWFSAAVPSAAGSGSITLHDRKEWSSSAPCGLNTTLNTALPQTSSPFTFPPADPMQHEFWHAPSTGVQWEKGSERRGCQNRLPPKRLLISPSLSGTESPQALATAIACSVKGNRKGSETLKHCDCLQIIPPTPRIHFLFLCFEAIKVWSLFGRCGSPL